MGGWAGCTRSDRRPEKVPVAAGWGLKAGGPAREEAGGQPAGQVLACGFLSAASRAAVVKGKQGCFVASFIGGINYVWTDF